MGIFKKPKTPEPTPQELALQKQQQDALNDETRDANARLKAIKRGAIGRRKLLGSFQPSAGMAGGGGSVRGGRAGRGSTGGGGGSGGGGGIMGPAAAPSGGQVR